MVMVDNHDGGEFLVMCLFEADPLESSKQGQAECFIVWCCNACHVAHHDALMGAPSSPSHTLGHWIEPADGTGSPANPALPIGIGRKLI